MAALPLLHVQFGLRQLVHLPCLSAAAIPVDLRVAKRGQTQRQIAAVEAFRVPADRDDRLCPRSPAVSSRILPRRWSCAGR